MEQSCSCEFIQIDFSAANRACLRDLKRAGEAHPEATLQAGGC
jgi:hypothetical protein